MQCCSNECVGGNGDKGGGKDGGKGGGKGGDMTASGGKNDFKQRNVKLCK